MPKPDRRSLLAKIAQTEARLVEIDAERTAGEAQLAELRAELAMLQQRTPRMPAPAPALAQTPASAAEKVTLFRSLFAGRTDVFPKYWHSPKTGKSGYSPVCNNEWVRGVCDKPRVKCGECPNQAFIPVTDQVILDHLQGRHIAGVYPLLEEDTCRFLVVDFDKGRWQEDVAAFVATCRRFDLPVAIERSRSGNGAHAWFFFSGRVPASAARKMGCYLITETMGYRHELPMSSYDRLFPNQDTLPRGGFGNLVALPLQHSARQDGNTVFLDDALVAYSDQWAYLAALPRMEPDRVDELARQASERGQVLGLRTAEDDESESPWLRPPSGRAPTARIDGSIPTQINAVLCQQLFVEKEDLPPALISQIRRLAAVQNPEFYKKQALRLSTALTPRVIDCAEALPHHIGLPRGCQAALEAMLDAYGATLTIEDRRSHGEPLELRFHGTLAPGQERAVSALLAHTMGVFVAPPGMGKTVVACYLIARRARNTLVLVHRTQLLDQWRTQLATFLDLTRGDIGQLGGGKRKLTERLDVAMIQSLVRRDEVDDIVASYGHVIVDECHHVPAVSFERVMRQVRARYVTGLTATPQRRDGHHPIVHFQLGPIRFRIDPKSQGARRQFDHRLIVRDTAFRLDGDTPGIQAIYRQLARDNARNELILNDVVQALEEGRSPVVLTERRDHLEYLAERLRPLTRRMVLLQGGMSVKQRREAIEKLASIPDGEERLVLATGRFIGEGFDDARLDTLFLAMPVSWKGTLGQYAGRLHRQHRAKTEVRIHDYVDREVAMLARMFDKRLKGYRSMGYEAAAALEANGMPDESYTVEYDQAALRLLDDNEF